MTQGPKNGPALPDKAKNCSISRSESRSTNRILASLPVEEFGRIAGSFHRVSFHRGQVVFDVTDRIASLYFPLTGMICSLSVMADGRTVVVAVKGREGFLGVPLLLSRETAPLRSCTVVS